MRCTNKYKQNGGVGVTVQFLSADKQSIAIYVMNQEEAETFKIGTFYEFSAEAQKPR